MAIKRIGSTVGSNGRIQLSISHDANGSFDDVMNQEIALLCNINESVATKVQHVGLLSNSSTVQCDTKLIRKFGLWSQEQKASHSRLFNEGSLNFCSTISVEEGIYFFGGVIAEICQFSEIIAFARQVNPSILIWSNHRKALVQYFEDMNAFSLVFEDQEFMPQVRVIDQVLIDLCRSTESFICIPNLEVDVSDADFVVIDPLNIVTPYLDA